MIAGPSSGDSTETPGMAVARMRHRARKTGQQLADLAGMSQAKISRIETGQTMLTEADADRLARALDESPDGISQLVALVRRTRQAMTAQQARNEMADWRRSVGAIGGIQSEVAELEARARIFRILQPSVIVGLAQTTEYAREILNSFEAIYGPSHGKNGVVDDGAVNVARAVSARIQRQEVLAQSDREFHFLMGEAALSERMATLETEHMLAQITRLRQLARKDNVTLRFIRADAEVPFPPLHGFELLDDSCVVIDIFNTSMMSRGRDDIASYRAVFDQLEASADADVAGVLDEYQRRYQGGPANRRSEAEPRR